MKENTILSHYKHQLSILLKEIIAVDYDNHNTCIHACGKYARVIDYSEDGINIVTVGF
jgi:hypothetical protein